MHSHIIIRILVIGMLVLLWVPLGSQAATYIVSEGQSIASALAMAADGDSVLVDAGQYHEDGLVMPSGVILAASSTDPQEYPVLSSEEGLSLLLCEDLSSATRIENLVFEGPAMAPEQLERLGGAIRSKNSAAVISGCVFRDLKAQYGGAVYCGSGVSLRIEQCTFSGNYAQASGGAVSVVGGQGLFLDYCLFTGNSAESGGCVLNVALSASASMNNCTLSENGLTDGADITVWDGQLIQTTSSILTSSAGMAVLTDHQSIPALNCCDVYGNYGGDWVGSIQDQAELAGNISEDPMFCGSGSEGSPYDISELSPCADSAQPGCGIIGAMPVGCDASTGTDGSIDSEITETTLPAVTRLRGNYPNPFNPRTTIAFDMSRAGHASVEVYDLAGRQVRRLHSGHLDAGPHEVSWNGRQADGRISAAGVYFFRLKTESVIDTQRMMLVK